VLGHHLRWGKRPSGIGYGQEGTNESIRVESIKIFKKNTEHLWRGYAEWNHWDSSGAGVYGGFGVGERWEIRTCRSEDERVNRIQ